MTTISKINNGYIKGGTSKMVSFCQCKDPDHKVNHFIEKATGEYINEPVKEIESFSCEGDVLKCRDFLCVSKEGAVYALKNREILDRFQCNIRKITRFLMGEDDLENKSDLKGISNQVSDLIENSPVLKKDINFWRGLDIKLEVNKGDIIDHKPFIFASFHENYARKFMDDTTDIYDSKKRHFSPFELGKKVDNSTLLKITVKAGTHFLEATTYFPRNEELTAIILNRGQKLVVTDIEELNGKQRKISVVVSAR